MVVAVFPGSPAQAAGMEPGDVITRINGHPVVAPSDVTSALAGRHPGDRLKLQFQGSGTTYTADVPLATGMYKKHGLDVELVNFSGPAKMHQAMAAGSLDIGVGAGTELDFIIKGAPEIAIADMAGPPLFLGMVVPYDSPARTADDLRGKRFFVGTADDPHREALLHQAPGELRIGGGRPSLRGSDCARRQHHKHQNGLREGHCCRIPSAA